VQVIIEAGTESVEWVTQELARADLRDKRLDRRLLKTLLSKYLISSL